MAGEVEQRIRDHWPIVPAHFDAEVYTGLRRMADRREITASQLDAGVRALVRFPAQRIPLAGLVVRAHALGRAFAPADAFYVALANALGIAFLTSDERLGRAATQLAGVRVLAISR